MIPRTLNLNLDFDHLQSNLEAIQRRLELATPSPYPIGVTAGDEAFLYYCREDMLWLIQVCDEFSLRYDTSINQDEVNAETEREIDSLREENQRLKDELENLRSLSYSELSE